MTRPPKPPAGVLNQRGYAAYLTLSRPFGGLREALGKWGGLGTVRGWLTKGFWAVMDQGLFATSNFALNVLLARWLLPAEYGAFGVAFAVFVLLLSLHMAVITEPMLIFSPGRYKDCVREYLGGLVYGNLAFGVICGLTLALVGGWFALSGTGPLSEAFFALALAGPFVSLLWLMRRACYARFQPHLAAYGGALYMVLMLLCAYALYRFGWLSTATALGAMGASSLAVSVWLILRLEAKLPGPRDAEMLRDFWRSHWQYGRWSVWHRALAWVPNNIYYLVLPLLGGLAAGASFKALMNLLMPMLQANAALAALLLPALVRVKGSSRFGSLICLALVPFVLAPALYWLLLGMFHGSLVSLAYGDRYADDASLLWLLGLLPIAAAVREVVSHSLRALERPDQLLVAYALSAVTAGVLGSLLMHFWGLLGAGTAMVASQAVAAAAVAAAVVLHLRSPGGRSPSRGGRVGG